MFSWIMSFMAKGLTELVVSVMGLIFAIYVAVFILRAGMAMLRTILDRIPDFANGIGDWMDDKKELWKAKAQLKAAIRKKKREEQLMEQKTKMQHEIDIINAAKAVVNEGRMQKEMKDLEEKVEAAEKAAI